MMNSATLRLVLLVSCAHALVHIYEHSFASVEQLVAADPAFHIDKADETKVTGKLGSCLRLPFGICALAAGWLADRFGAKRLLMFYLIGCSLASAMAWLAPNLGFLFLAMFTLGVFASIYHPAGVSLITHHTNPENRPMALGYHGILGSAGIAAGPLLAGLVLGTGASWHQYYLVLTVPGVLLAVLLALRLAHHQQHSLSAESKSPDTYQEDSACWASYFVLLATTSLAGIVYAGVLNFLPRYLGNTGLNFAHVPEESLRNYLTSAVLLLGIIGQYAAGRIATPATLELLMACAFLAATPCVMWMGLAHGVTRLWAAAVFSPLFFMQQPLFNSLVAKYVPRRRRSTCYGLSFTLGFGIGSTGPTIAGYAPNDLIRYGTLAALLAVAACLALLLWRWNRPTADEVVHPPEPLDEEEALF